MVGHSGGQKYKFNATITDPQAQIWTKDNIQRPFFGKWEARFQDSKPIFSNN